MNPPRRTVEEIAALFQEPFHPEDVRFGVRAGVVFYDSRVVQERLDFVVGVDGWVDEYEVLNGGHVICRLGVKIGGDWVTKVDLGSPGEPGPGGAAGGLQNSFNDALCRAAVKFGIGRYLYWEQPQQPAATPQVPTPTVQTSQPLPRGRRVTPPPIDVPLPQDVPPNPGVVRQWAEWLLRGPDLQDVNTCLTTTLLALEPGTRKAVWGMIHKYCLEQGLTYNQQAGSFAYPT